MIQRVFEIDKFRKSNHKWIKNLSTDVIVNTVAVITNTSLRSFKSHSETRDTRASFKKSSEFSSKWTTNKAQLKSDLLEFFRKIQKFRDTIDKSFESKFKREFSSSSKLSLSSSVEQDVTRRDFKKNTRQRSNSWTELISNSPRSASTSKEFGGFRSLNLSEKKQVKSTSRLNKSRHLTMKSVNDSDKSDQKISQTNRSNSRSRIETNMIEQLNLAIIAVIIATVNATFAAQTSLVKSSNLSNLSDSQGSTRDTSDNETFRWNSEDIDYFDSNYEGKSADTEELVTHSKKDIYYRDVHIFVKRVKKMTMILKTNTVRNNLSTCLRETALIWHTAELTNISRRILKYENEVEEWTNMLTQRFKQQSTSVTTTLLKESYIMKNARKHRESREYVQKIIRLTKSAEMRSMFNQLNIIYNEIDATLKRDLNRSSSTSTIDEFLQKLNEHKKIWWNLTKQERNQNVDREYDNQKYTSRNNQFAVQTYSYRSDLKRENLPYYQQTLWNRYLKSSRSFRYQQVTQSQMQFSYQQQSQMQPQMQSYQQQQMTQQMYQQQFQKTFQKQFQKQFDQFNSENAQRKSLSKSRMIMSSSTQKYLTLDNFANASISILNQSQRNSSWNEWRGQRNPDAYQQNMTNRSWQNQAFSQRAYFENKENFEQEYSDQNEDEEYDEETYEFQEEFQIESEDVQNMKSKHSNKTTTHSMISEFVLRCRNCDALFYSNNKLHRHLRKSCKTRSNVYHVESVLTKVSIVTSNKKFESSKEYEFRRHQNAIAKIVFKLKKTLHDICMNSGIFMSLIDRDFIRQQRSNLEIRKAKTTIKIREIDGVHDNSEYVELDIFISEKIKKSPRIAQLRIELHLIDALKVNVLIETNVLILEEMILIFVKKIFTIFSCDVMKVSIQVERKKEMMNRIVRILRKTVILSKKLETVSVRIKKTKLSKDRDYSFFSIIDEKLESKGGFCAHVVDSNIKIVQVRNTSAKVYVLSKNLKIDHLKEYEKHECYLILSEERHKAVITKKNSILWKFHEEFKDDSLKNKLENEITIWSDEVTIKRIKTVIDQYSNVWKFILEEVNISENQWMQIKIISEKHSESIRVFKLDTEDKEIVDKKFDNLQTQEKLEYFKKATSYAFSVFVVWTMIYLNDKPMRKTRVIVDIRELNKITEFDAYSMSLQSNIISCIQNCKFIFLMNEATFFYQWWIKSENHHKMTIVIHREVEQWNVAVMKFKNSSVHVQRQMNNCLRKFRGFARSYIDDVMIFSKILEEHLQHLQQVLELLKELNITLKSTKTFLSFSSIAFLEQKINAFELSTAKKKLETIIKLSFFKTLKKLETYLEMIEYLRDYILYYAQKVESLQIRKTMLLKNESIQELKRRTFSKETFLKKSITKKLDAFEQLQADFARSSWLTHFDKSRILHVDVNVSKKEFEVIVYHLKKKRDFKDHKISSKKDVDSILFLSKILTSMKSRYWPTKLEMTELIWTIRRTAHMMKSSNHVTIIYIDHEAISRIVDQIKLSSTNIDKQNLKLVRIFMYLSQFRVEIRHRSEKFNIILDVLSRLSTKKRELIKRIDLETYDNIVKDSTNDETHAFVVTLIAMSLEFRKKILNEYFKKKSW